MPTAEPLDNTAVSMSGDILPSLDTVNTALREYNLASDDLGTYTIAPHATSRC
jgi:hypothetical protein